MTANTQNQGIGGQPGPEYYMVRQHTADDLIFRYPDSQRISMVVRTALDPRAFERPVEIAGQQEPDDAFCVRVARPLGVVGRRQATAQKARQRRDTGVHRFVASRRLRLCGRWGIDRDRERRYGKREG